MADAENVDITLAEVARRLSHSPRWLRVILAYDPPNWLRSARERTQAMVKRAYQAVAPRATADHCQFPVALGCRRWRGPSSSAKPNRKRSPRKTISKTARRHLRGRFFPIRLALGNRRIATASECESLYATIAKITGPQRRPAQAREPRRARPMRQADRGAWSTIEHRLGDRDRELRDQRNE